jgi:phosphatidylinositol glycan class B
MDESDVFYDDPSTFLRSNFPPVFNKKLRTPGRKYKYEWPTHLVIFEALEPVMSEYLKDSPYEECNRFFNSYFHWDNRRQGDVIVYCKWPWE